MSMLVGLALEAHTIRNAILMAAKPFAQLSGVDRTIPVRNIE
jgi:hypothetical protein